MMKRFSLALLAIAALAVSAFVLFGHPPVAFAQTGGTGGLTSGLDAVGATVNLPSSDPRVIAVRVINVALGLLAILMVTIIVYAGFLYMTAGGDAEKVRKAIAYIRNAIIGLIIILLSWAIARYVITRLMEAAGGGGGGTTTGPGPGGGGFGPGAGSSQFRILAITPTGSVDTRKVIVKIVFTRPVDADTAQATGAITVERVSDGAAVAGTVEVNGSAVRFRPNTPCPAPNDDRFCFDENTEFRVRVASSLRSTSDQAIACGGFAPDCEGRFQTGTTVDVTPPEVSITYPLSGFSVSADALVDVSAFVRDETAVSYVSFADNGNAIGDSAPVGVSPRQFDAHVQWDTAGIAPGSSRTLSATGYDVDSGSAMSDPVTVMVRAPHCFDGTQNEGETGIDCGGNPADANACGACQGGSCVDGTQCASGVCTAGVCVEQPIITGVDPLDGAPGSFVTIRGVNFGTNGTVAFLGSGTPVNAAIPAACQAAGVSPWSPREVVVEVPTGAQTGPIRLTNGVSTLSDATNAVPNPYIADFVVNDTIRPGICAIVPNVGSPSTVFRLIGTGFGTTAAGVQFGDRSLGTSSWTDEQIESSIPNVELGTYPVSVNVASISSNVVGMRVSTPDTGGAPEIVEISPAQGPIGTYVTISGRNFGSSVGSVYFLDTRSGNAALADTSLPDACTDGAWTSSAITVKVPPVFTQGSSGALTPGSYAVYVRTARATAPESNRVNFAVNTDPLAPGICSIVPRVAPIGSSVTVYGENLTTGPGSVVYHSSVVGGTSSWTATQIASIIPAGAQTGPVRTRITSSGLSSNPYPIQVRNCNEAVGVCEGSEECCTDGACRAAGTCSAAAGTAMFAWRFSTGVVPRAPRVLEQCDGALIPSPSPWSQRDGGQAACVNSTPVMAFTTQIDPASITPQSGNVIVQRCTASGADPCVQTEAVTITAAQLRQANASQDYVVLNVGTLQPSSWYRVSLSTGVRGAGEGGLNMEEDERCGDGMAYCYQFRTRDDATPCAIATVSVAPNPFTAHEQNQSVAYAALPIPEGDRCVVLACEPYGWAWRTGDARATITHTRNPQNPAIGEACEQTATALAETGPSNPVQIIASASGATGAGDLYIRFVPPEVTSYGPHCDGACGNAAIWASFNVPLNPTTVHAGNVRIERCANEACQELLEPPTLDLSQSLISLRSIPDTSGSDGRFIVIEPSRVNAGVRTSLLEPGRYYRVILRGGQDGNITSSSDVPMSSLNHPDGFAWIFRVKQGVDASCTAQRISVSPAEKYETLVGARQGFSASAHAAPDSCDARGQLLMSFATTGFSWNSADRNVATLLNNGAVDTGTVRAPGCTDRCTPVGAQGEFGRTARCGNAVVETTDASTCVGAVTRSGQACRVLPAGSTGGEECDGGTGCNTLCLFEPVLTVDAGGSCGDGVKQPTEDCDYGRFCMGVSATSTVQQGSDCTTATQRNTCIANGGTCSTLEVRGCSVRCRHLGANAGMSTCGNGDVSDGEDCDDGNVASGDGCSANCLHEGSRSDVYALCGNRILESGESCEMNAAGAWPAGCDHRTCLHTGLSPCETAGATACCGNGIREDGEDCDGGEGCSAICLLQGSSVSYAQASFCGDGVPGVGEFAQCEASPSGPDGLVDAYQVAEVIGRGTVNADGLMSTDIRASQSGVSGAARYGLRCGFTQEQMCSTDGVTIRPDVGLSQSGCCSARPSVSSLSPSNGETDVCRNALIQGTFNVEIDEGSFAPNFIVAQVVAGTSCPSGMTQVTMDGVPQTGWRFTVARWWNALLELFRIRSASAQVYCAGGVIGRTTFGKSVITSSGVERTVSTFSFSLENALAPDTLYRVILRGDHDLTNNADLAQRVGIRSKDGVVSNQDWVWTFTTGREVCRINRVTVSDQTTEHPLLFTASGEAHPFRATAESKRADRYVAISPTSEYRWEWQNWAVSQTAIASVTPETAAAETISASERSIAAGQRNGSAFVSARVRITEDTVSVPSTRGSVVQGTAPITVQLCENPWPSKAEAPFRDELDSPSLVGTAFERGPFYNVSMTYCRDASDPGPIGDLPSLTINAVNTNAADTAQGILRQYLFTFSDPSLKKDAIGMRIALNPIHLSPLEWYRAKGFTGSPTAMTVDGYQAIRDGRSVYISAASTQGPGQALYSNIYILSYNDGASTITKQIFEALLQSMMFNRNIQSDVAAVCQDGSGGLVNGANGSPVHCSADWECLAYGSGLSCANFKGKLQRDLMRLGDFQNMTRLLEESKKQNGSYPQLKQGSYLPGWSTSLWPSWSDGLRTEAKSALPQDPINRFVTCGRCSGSGNACTADADCSAGQTCQAQDGFDPKTCWNASSNVFSCPVQGSGGTPASRVYAYQSLLLGQRYELSAEFEVPPPTADPSQSWWEPPLMTEWRQCTNGSAAGRYCYDDSDCRICPVTGCTGTEATPSGACVAVGGRFNYAGFCTGQQFGMSSVCGDGVLDVDAANYRCLGGSNDNRSCRVAADCPGGTCGAAEVCETVGATASRYATCRIGGASGTEGREHQICNACRSYVTDPNNKTCQPLSQCGNGRTEGRCSTSQIACTVSTECPGYQAGETCVGEVCDDGTLNGTYGHCNIRCNGYEGGCGDGMISGGEVCDLGLSGSNPNREWCAQSASNCPSVASSCNLSCSGPAGRCGDGVVTRPFEACDGNNETTDRAICSDGSTACSTNADCPNGGTCGTGGSSMSACTAQRVCIGGSNDGTTTCTTDANCPGGRCSTETAKTEHRRVCQAPGATQACQFAAWSGCLPSQSCGNGVKDSGEACDDGNDSDTDVCTTACLRNVCGDGILQQGVEECDMGTENGQACTSAEYGSTCSSCSTSCKYQLTQGGFCGDGIKQTGSSEQCDGDTVNSVQTNLGRSPSADGACQALGYDYLASDRVHCGQTCSFTGCAYCGERPDTVSATDQNFQGVVEGTLFDTLFQQPVPNARVTLFYRGLQVAVTTSDNVGFFSFSGLDRHAGCGSYRMVIDSYIDNPLTTLLDESKRGGYMTVQVPPFAPHLDVATESGTSGRFSNVVTSAQLGQLVNHPTANYQIPQISMLPRLRDKEYITQLWWTPNGGTAAVLDRFAGLADDAARDAMYAEFVSELHDLVIRQPFTYAPGSFGACQLSGKPGMYDPKSSDTRVNGRNPSTGAAGVNGIDVTNPLTGMQSCTNKIRATFSKTCQVYNSSNAVVRDTLVGCTDASMCDNQGITLASGESTKCTGAPEQDRQGSIEVLDGKEGAYLFCYHPEWLGVSGSEGRAGEVNCSNFIVPPQSAFIRSSSGQFDVLVSKYLLGMYGQLLHRGGSENDNAIRAWLTARSASVRVYDQFGLRETVTPSRTGGTWASNDNAARVCLASNRRTGFNQSPWRDNFSANLMTLGEVNYSPVWTPLSINGSIRSDQAVKVWGNAGADFHYFSDMAHRWTDDNFMGADCWERQCASYTFPGQCIGPGGTLTSTTCTQDSQCGAGYGCYNSFPRGGLNFCHGGTADYATNWDVSTGAPACDSASRAACPPGSTCATQVNASVRCVQVCTTDAQCTKGGGSYCGGLAGSCYFGSASGSGGR